MWMKRWRGERWFHAHETARLEALEGLPLASFWRRAVAFTLDGLLVALAQAPFQIAAFFIARHFGQQAPFPGKDFKFEPSEIAQKIEEIAGSVLYFGVLLKLGNGRTPGKALMKIRVISLTHGHVGWWQSIERALGYGASLLEGGFGFLQYWMNTNRMCVHDRIAETIVVDERRPVNRHAAAVESLEGDSTAALP